MFLIQFKALQIINDDFECSIGGITGHGSYYTAGNDISNFLRFQDPDDATPEPTDMLIDFVDAFINFEKPLIAGVNGPAIGIGVTTLALCDLVLASSNSTFQCPFTKIGQSPEGTSSYSMPAILGPSGSSELLLRNNIFTVDEMVRLKLVGRIIDKTQFKDEFESTLIEYSNFPPESLRLSKELIRSNTLGTGWQEK